MSWKSNTGTSYVLTASDIPCTDCAAITILTWYIWLASLDPDLELDLLNSLLVKNVHKMIDAAGSLDERSTGCSILKTHDYSNARNLLITI